MKPREIFEILTQELGPIPNNEEEAQKWFKEAFEKGSDRVKKALIELLSYDVIRPDNENEKIWWIFNGVLQGKENFKKLLRQLYYKGHGEENTRKEIVSYHRKEAKNEDVDSMIFLGHIHTGGFGVDQDRDKANEWYKKAAKKGDAGAQLAVADYHFDKKEFQEAYKWYVKAAENDKKTALIKLSLMHKKGLGTKVNEEKATHYLNLLRNKEKFRLPKNKTLKKSEKNKKHEKK